MFAVFKEKENAEYQLYRNCWQSQCRRGMLYKELKWCYQLALGACHENSGFKKTIGYRLKRLSRTTFLRHLSLWKASVYLIFKK
jgi:hypothetical protein